MVEQNQGNLLVTGGTGFIGSHTIVEILQTKGRCGYNKIVIIDNLSNSSTGVIEKVNEITGTDKDAITFVECDIRDEDLMTKVFTDHGPITGVIHFAGLKAVGESVSQPLKYYENNVGGSVSLLKVMQKFNCNNIVFSSSATVYGDNPQAKETDQVGVNITNPYGQTKAFIEIILKDHAKTNPNFSAVILRYFNPVGAHPSGLIGEDPEGIPNNLMPYVQRIAGGQLPHLNVFGSDYESKDGTGVRDYIHIVDLARGHIAALNKQGNEGLRGWHPFNLGTGNGTTVIELVDAFEKASGVTIKRIMVGRREGDVCQLLAVPDKAHSELDWKAEYGIEQMCKDSWAFVQNQKVGQEKKD